MIYTLSHYSADSNWFWLYVLIEQNILVDAYAHFWFRMPGYLATKDFATIRKNTSTFE